MCVRVKLSSRLGNSYVPKLPVIYNYSHDFPEWNKYLNKVYGNNWIKFDLNEFEWFYWHSPIGKILKPKTVFLYDKVNWNEAWIMPKTIPRQNQKWEKNTCKYPPEGLYNQIGFFVRRKRIEPNIIHTSRHMLEVLRYRYDEIESTWFYNLKGSGIFINKTQYELRKSNYPHAFNLQEYSIPRKTTNFDDTCKNMTFHDISGGICNCSTGLDYLNRGQCSL